MIDNIENRKSRYLINVDYHDYAIEVQVITGAHIMLIFSRLIFFVIDETLLTFRSNFLHNNKTVMITATDIHIFNR